MKRAMILSLCVVTATVAAVAHDDPDARFRAADNRAGAGFFWVDSTTGDAWWSLPGQYRWKYLGRPDGAEAGAIGTYVPRAHQSGPGVFILNTRTGQGWWTDGVSWRALGRPETVADKP